MRPKSIALLVLALGCGLVASVGITQVIGRRPSGQPTEMGTVYMAAKNIAMGEPLTATMVQAEQWPLDKIPRGVATKMEDLDGRRCMSRLIAGEVIYTAKLTEKTVGVSDTVPKGFRVATVKVDAVSGAASMILPGDRVDVVGHFRPGPANPEPLTRTILQYVKVFAVDSTVSLEGIDSDGKSIPAKTVSLLVTPDQAQKVALASEMGTVRLVLRPLGDTEIQTVSPTTPEELLGKKKTKGDGRVLAAAEGGKVATAQSALADMLKSLVSRATSSSNGLSLVQNERHVMRVMMGNRSSDVVMEAETAPLGTPQSKKFWRTSGEQNLSNNLSSGGSGAIPAPPTASEKPNAPKIGPALPPVPVGGSGDKVTANR